MSPNLQVCGFAIIQYLGDLVRKCDPLQGSSLSRPASPASALEATRNCTTSLILQHLLLKVGGFAIIQYLGDLVRKCDPVRGSSLSRPASVAPAWIYCYRSSLGNDPIFRFVWAAWTGPRRGRFPRTVRSALGIMATPDRPTPTENSYIVKYANGVF